jgi:hypothetical protein
MPRESPGPVGAEFQMPEPHELLQLGNKDIEFHRGPPVELYNILEQSAIDLAKTVVQTSLILNGGGILAPPAIAPLLGQISANTLESLVWSGISFTCGIGSAFITSVKFILLFASANIISILI